MSPTSAIPTRRSSRTRSRASTGRAARTSRFHTGTDEHGQKIEREALAQGIAPRAFADRVVARFHEWPTLSTTHDDFIRTTEERHARGVVALIRRIEAAGDLYTARHEGWYCTACEAYYTEKELLAGNLCPDHGTPCAWQSEENVFFRLSKYQEPLLAFYARTPGSSCRRPASGRSNRSSRRGCGTSPCRGPT